MFLGKKYYIAAKHIAEQGDNCVATYATEREAVEQAKELIRWGKQDRCFIVKIISVVRRDDPPIIVEAIS